MDKRMRLFYWLGLVLAALLLVIFRWDGIWGTSDLPVFDRGLLLALAILLGLPLVSEFEAFGVTVKSRLSKMRDELINEIQTQFASLRVDLRVVNQAQSEVTVNLLQGEQLNSLGKQFSDAMAPDGAEGVRPRGGVGAILKQLPEDFNMATGIHQAMRHEVDRIWHAQFGKPPAWLHRTLQMKIQDLDKEAILDPTTANVALQVARLSSLPDSGAILSGEQRVFLQLVADPLMDRLSSINVETRH